MRYLGGKAKVAKQIAEIIGEFRVKGQKYVEPFVGAASVFSLVPGPKVGFDICPELISLLRAVRDGWDPPSKVTRDEYYEAKRKPGPPWLQAFIGFGCSYGGKWFGGYASTEGRNYAAEARYALLKLRPGLSGAPFFVGDFLDYYADGCIIYCDPPYRGTTLPGKKAVFDYDAFWKKAASLAERNTVLVSELTAPKDYPVLWESRLTSTLATGTTKARIDKLFLLDR